MHQPDYDELDTDTQKRLSEVFDQETKKLDDLLKKHGPDHLMRVFTPKPKKAHLKPIKK